MINPFRKLPPHLIPSFFRSPLLNTDILYRTLLTRGVRTITYIEKNSNVFFKISINGKEVGKVVIKLYDDVVPKTCANFRSLCTGKVRFHLLPFRQGKHHSSKLLLTKYENLP